MSDPLSVAASVIAVIQAAQVGLDLLKRLKDAPKDFSEVQTELCGLHDVSVQIRNCLAVINSGATSDPESPVSTAGLLKDDELVGLKTTANDIKRVIDELNNLIESSADSKGILKRLIWLRKDGKAKELRRDARRLQSNLRTHLSSLAPIQITRHNSEMKELLLQITPQKSKPVVHHIHSNVSEEGKIRKTGIATGISPVDLLSPYTAAASGMASDSQSTAPDVRVSKHNANPSGSHRSDEFPISPADKPAKYKGQAERILDTGETAGVITYATASAKRELVKTENDFLAQDNEALMGVNTISSGTHMIINPVDLLDGLDSYSREQREEGAPGSVGGILEMELLPPPGGPDTERKASLESDERYQETEETIHPIPPLPNPVTYPEPYTAVQPYYWRSTFRDDHLAMYDCSCPRPVTVGSPSRFRRLFGFMVVTYMMPPLYTGLVCCNPACGSKPKRHVQLCFQLPSWLATNASLSLFSWDTLQGPSRILQFRMLREIVDAEVVMAIDKGDVRWLQQRLAQKRLLPFDILKGIGDPLAYSLTYIGSDRGYAVTNFLLRSGFNSLSKSYQGYNASYIARLKLRAGLSHEHRHLSSILHEIAALDDDSTLDNSTPLHDAALRQIDSTLREVLASNQQNIDSVDGLGFTALHWSVIREDIPHVKTLLKAGADMNATTTVHKWSPLHLACMKSSLEITTALIEAGAELEREDHKGQTPLHHVPIGDPDLVGLLLSHGADAKHEDYQGNTVLHSLASLKQGERRGGESIRKLIQHGADGGRANARGETPYMLMAMHNNACLLYNLCVVEMASFGRPFPMYNWNILHYAAYYWDISSLLNVSWDDWEVDGFEEFPGFDPDAPDENGRTALDALEYRMFVPDDERMAGVYRPTREEVEAFLWLLRNFRETNWKAGKYLETEQKFRDDGSLERMETWLKTQFVHAGLTSAQDYRRYNTSLWQVADPWWRETTTP